MIQYLDTAELHVGDIGVELLVAFHDVDAAGEKVPVDLTGASSLVLLAQPPKGGTLKTWTLTVVSAAAGTAKYVLASGDLDMAGKWTMQGRLVKPSVTVHSQAFSIEVAHTLQAAP